MKLAEIEALADGLAPVIRDLMAAAVSPLTQQITTLQAEIAELRSIDHAATVADLVADAVGKLPPPVAGKDADPEETMRLVDEAVKCAVAALPPAEPDTEALVALVEEKVSASVGALPPAEPGRSVTVEDVQPLIVELLASEVAKLPPAEPGAPGEVDQEALAAIVAETVTAAIAEIPAPVAGKDADPEVTAELVRIEVERAIAALPAPEPGKSVTVEELAPLVEETIAKAVAALPPPKKGEPGAPGALPIVKAWTDDVTHEGEVRTHAGATWQATKDTAKEPPHADWTCLAAAGEPGTPARQIDIRGTYAADGDYAALNIVALNGGAFIARKDDPGPCPGEDWQVIAMRGKPGEPGKKGDPGPSVKGPPGAPVVSAHIDDQGLLVLVNGDGSTVDCDLYPVLSKVMN